MLPARPYMRAALPGQSDVRPWPAPIEDGGERWEADPQHLIEVRVGGEKFAASEETLARIPFFAPQLCASRRPRRIEVCRSPDTFAYILDFARNRGRFPHGPLTLPANLARDADFFCYEQLLSEVRVHPYRCAKRQHPTSLSTCALAVALMAEGREEEAQAKMGKARLRLGGASGADIAAHIEARWCIQQHVTASTRDARARWCAAFALMGVGTQGAHADPSWPIFVPYPPNGKIYASMARLSGLFWDPLRELGLLEAAWRFAPDDAEIQTQLALAYADRTEMPQAHPHIEHAAHKAPTAQRLVLSAHIFALVPADKRLPLGRHLSADALVRGRCQRAIDDYGHLPEVWNHLRRYFPGQEACYNLRDLRGEKVVSFTLAAARCAEASAKMCLDAAFELCRADGGGVKDHSGSGPEEAEHLYRRAATLYQAQGDSVGHQTALRGLASFLIDVGRSFDAAACYKEIIFRYEHVEVPETHLGQQRPSTFACLATLYEDIEHFELAAEAAKSALIVAPCHIATLFTGARCTLALGSWSEAQDWLGQVEAYIARVSNQNPLDPSLASVRQDMLHMKLNILQAKKDPIELTKVLDSAQLWAPSDEMCLLHRAKLKLGGGGEVDDGEALAHERALRGRLQDFSTSHAFNRDLLYLSQKMGWHEIAGCCVQRLHTAHDPPCAHERIRQTADLLDLAQKMLAWAQPAFARPLVDRATRRRLDRTHFGPRVHALQRELSAHQAYSEVQFI